jgi:hypothetical protein
MDDDDAHAETYGRRLIASAMVASTIIFCATALVVTLLILYGS